MKEYDNHKPMSISNEEPMDKKVEMAKTLRSTDNSIAETL